MTPAPDTPAAKSVLGDVLHERAHALMDAVNLAREALCVKLDGPQEDAQNARYKDAVPALREEWQAFTTVLTLAQRRIEGRP